MAQPLLRRRLRAETEVIPRLVTNLKKVTNLTTHTANFL